MSFHLLSCAVVSALLVSCGGGGGGGHEEVPASRPVSIEVEVYDPVTGRVWEDVAVRIVDGTLEWSGLTIEHHDPEDWWYTDMYGTVYFDEVELALAQIGFAEDPGGYAVLDPDPDRDEAFVQIELTSPGFLTVRADVQLSWDEPDVFISIPFVPHP